MIDFLFSRNVGSSKLNNFKWEFITFSQIKDCYKCSFILLRLSSIEETLLEDGLKLKILIKALQVKNETFTMCYDGGKVKR